MGYQDDYVMRTITDLVNAIATVALGKTRIDYELPEKEEELTDAGRLYRRLTALADAGDLNGAENLLYEELHTDDLSYLEMGLGFYMYLNRFSNADLYGANFSREEIAEGINSLSAAFGISGFESFIDTTIL